MLHPNQELINKFFEAFGNHNLNGIRQVMAENTSWTFPGHNSFSGTKVGIEQVVAFFDAMGAVMGKSSVRADQLVVGVNDHYVVECQHIRTHREEGNNLEHLMCVLWSFENGKIIAGRHFAAEELATDKFIAALMK